MRDFTRFLLNSMKSLLRTLQRLKGREDDDTVNSAITK